GLEGSARARVHLDVLQRSAHARRAPEVGQVLRLDHAAEDELPWSVEDAGVGELARLRGLVTHGSFLSFPPRPLLRGKVLPGKPFFPGQVLAGCRAGARRACRTARSRSACSPRSSSRLRRAPAAPGGRAGTGPAGSGR